jgi:hypothetical protein
MKAPVMRAELSLHEGNSIYFIASVEKEKTVMLYIIGARTDGARFRVNTGNRAEVNNNVGITNVASQPFNFVLFPALI